MRWADAWRYLRVVLLAFVALVVMWIIPALRTEEAAVEAQSAGVRVPVLVYHNIDYSGSAYAVTPEMLDAQCQWLINNGYTTITVYQLYDAIVNGSALPANPILMTNDDGWASAVTFADVLGRNGLVGNYFINNYSPLSPDEIRFLAANGPVQAHTANHQYMSQLDYATQYAELADNKAYIEGITGQPVEFLAWPFGDFNQSAIQAAMDAGFIAAFGLSGVASYVGGNDLYNIPRIMLVVDDNLDTFAGKAGHW